MRESTTQVPPLSPVSALDALDASLVALAAAHRQLAAVPADFLRRSGLFVAPLADVERWHDAQLRIGYFTLIAANRGAGALVRHALGVRGRDAARG